jgi:hypothetical protein
LEEILTASYTGTAAPATISEEMYLSGRKYTVFWSLALLAGPLLLFWAAVVILAVHTLHWHAVLVGVK